MPTAIYLALSTAFASFVKQVAGFGNTLIITTLFAFVMESRLISPLALIITTPANIVLLVKERKKIQIKKILPITCLVLAGVIPGTFFLKVGDDRVLKIVLGVFIILLAAEMATRGRSHAPTGVRRQIGTVAIGLITGIMAGLFGISTTLAAYMHRTTEGRGSFRGSLAFVFLTENLFRVFYYWANGLFSREAGIRALWLLPFFALGVFAGIRADRHISDKALNAFVIVLLILSGASLVIKNAMALAG